MKTLTHKIFGPEQQILNPNPNPTQTCLVELGCVWVHFHSLIFKYLAIKQTIHCYSLVYH